jgi:hypothetical protein
VIGVLFASGVLSAGEAPAPQPLVVPPPFEIPPVGDVPGVVDEVIIPEAMLLADALLEDDSNGVAAPPDIAPPHAPAKPGALILRWDRYRTLVVIDTSGGLVKSCWVVTLSTMPEQIPTPRGPVTLARGQVVVAYRAQAYHSKDGTLHVDARRARLSGVLASNWSPDSFAISPTKEVSAHDDDPSHPSNSGEVEKEIPADTQRDEFRRLLYTAMVIVQGTI